MYFIRLLLLFVFWGYSLSALSQINECEHCGNKLLQLPVPKFKHEPWHGNNAYLDTVLAEAGYLPDSEKILYRVPVKFHVHRSNEGKDGISEREVKEYVNYLNYYHSINRTGFRFYLQPEVNYIDKNRYHKVGYIRQTLKVSRMDKQKGSVNVHIVKSLAIYSGGKAKRSFFGVHNKLTKGIIVKRRSATATLSHEIGHYFGLAHPHKYYKRGKRKQEPVSRTRKRGNKLLCETNGDKLADTPAEPDLSNYTNKKCEYIGGDRDKWGDLYEPKTDNVMSYGKYRECRTKFTRGQTGVMLYYAAKNKNADGWSTSKRGSENYAFDTFEPDNSSGMATEIFFLTPQTHTFHKIYKGKRYINGNDELDYMFFKVRSEKTKTVRIKVGKGNLAMSELELSVMRNDKVLKTQKIRSGGSGELKLQVRKGKYYIRVKDLSPGDEISDYRIEVTKPI